jgi:hypothetical protein
MWSQHFKELLRSLFEVPDPWSVGFSVGTTGPEPSWYRGGALCAMLSTGVRVDCPCLWEFSWRDTPKT